MMRPRQQRTPWVAYSGAVFATLALAWSVTSAWFDLQARVTWLERAQKYTHGTFEIPKGE